MKPLIAVSQKRTTKYSGQWTITFHIPKLIIFPLNISGALRTVHTRSDTACLVNDLYCGNGTRQHGALYYTCGLKVSWYADSAEMADKAAEEAVWKTALLHYLENIEKFFVM